MPYINSYLRSYSDFPTTILNSGTSVTYLGDYFGLRKFYAELAFIFDRYLGNKKSIFIAVSACAGGLALCALWPDPYYVVVCYGIILGFGCGLLALVALWPMWSYFGATNGKATGVVLMGYSLGPGLIGLAFTHIANPENYAPSSDGGSDNLIYPEEVNQRVPLAIYIISAAIFLIGMFALCIISENTKSLETTEGGQTVVMKELPYKAIFKTVKFWRLAIIMYFQYFIYGFFLSNYKIILLNHIHDDHLVAYAGSACFISSILGRVVFSALLDYTSFKVSSSIINMTSLIFLVTLPMIWEIESLAIFWTSIIFFVTSGLYPSYLIEIGRNFNPETTRKLFPIFMLFITMSTFSASSLTEVGDIIGLENVLYVLGTTSLIDQIILTLWNIKEKPEDQDLLLDMEEEAQEGQKIN